MLVTVIINSMGSAVGPKINVIAMPSGIIPTGPDDASCVDPGYFSVSRVYDVPNDTTSIIIRSVEYNCSTPGVCDDYEMSIIPAYDTTTSTSSTSTSTTSTSSTSTSSTSTSTTSTSSTSTSTTSTSSTSTSTTSTSTSSSTTTTSTTEEPGDGTCYNLDIPEDKLTLGEEDLYIAYTLPGETLAEVLITNIPSTDEHPGYYTINICSMTVPLYSYGEPHNHVSIPEIIVTVSGSCNEDNECTSPTTTTSTSSTTTTTTTIGTCYNIKVPDPEGMTNGGYTLSVERQLPFGELTETLITGFDATEEDPGYYTINICSVIYPLFEYDPIVGNINPSSFGIIITASGDCLLDNECTSPTTTTSTTIEPTTTTTTTTEPPLCYHIEIPDDKLTYLGADLYINRQLPGGSSEEIVYFNIPETEERVDYYVINICSIFEPLFSYGSPYNHVSIPEIEITINGTCDEDTDCVSPTTTSTSSTTTTSTTICPLYEVYLQIADTANDACVAPSVQYWMDTVVFGIGSEIYSDCGTTLITNTYAVKVDTQRIYTVSAGVIATDTGDDCV